MPDIPEDDTALAFLDEDEFRTYFIGMVSESDRHALFPKVSAEMNRRLARGQMRQLQAQARQNDAQLEVASSLKRATWWLSVATMILAAATVAARGRNFLSPLIVG